MGDAERAARRREQEAAARKAAQKAEKDRNFLMQYQAELPKVEALIHQALAVLEAAGWPGSTMIRVQRKHMKAHMRACWPVGVSRVDRHGESGTVTIYLLSTGQLVGSSMLATSAREMLKDPSIEDVANGLQELIKKYGK